MQAIALAKGGRYWGESLMAFRFGIQAGQKKMQKYRVKYAEMFTELFGPLAIITPLASDENPFAFWFKYFVWPEEEDDDIVEYKAV